MEEKENTALNIEHTEVEALVNRWLSEYFSHRAVTCFKDKKYDEFDAIKSQLDSVLTLPMDMTGLVPSNHLVVRFLSRIKDGENLDVFPLEETLTDLEEISINCDVPEQNLKDVSHSIKDMIVKILIKNECFDKAQEMLNKYFPTSVDEECVLMNLIRQKSKEHQIIRQLSFERFTEEMGDFCQKITSAQDPFLYRVAREVLQKRKMREEECSDQDDSVALFSSSSGLSCIHVAVAELTRVSDLQKTRLEPVDTAWAADDENRKTFTQQEEETLEPGSQPSAGPERLQRDARSPLEASPADQPQQTDGVPETQISSPSLPPPVLRSRRSYTVAQLVMDPDSQPSSQDSELSTEEQPQTQDNVELTIPVRKCPTRTRKPRRRNSRATESTADSEEEEFKPPETSLEPNENQNASPTDEIHITDSSLEGSTNQKQPSDPHTHWVLNPRPSFSKWKEKFNSAKESKDTWSDEESCFTSKKSIRLNTTSSSTSGQMKRMWTDHETQMLKEGVKKYGEGNWRTINSHYSFNQRTNVHLKDRWRTMQRLNIV